MNVVFDSNIFISRPHLVLSARTYFSSIVLTELLVGAQDATRIKELKLWRQLAIKFDRFIVPDAEDWLQAGLALQRLSQQSKRENFGSTPKLSPEERQPLFNDCLLAFPAAALESPSSPTTSKISIASLLFAASSGNAATNTSRLPLFEQQSIHTKAATTPLPYLRYQPSYER